MVFRSVIYLFAASLIVSGCSQKTSYNNSELTKATNLCNSQFPDSSKQNRNNSEYNDCVAKDIGMSSENLLKAANKIENRQLAYNNARNQCGEYLGVNSNITKGLNLEFDNCINRVLGVPSLQDLQTLAAIRAARRPTVYNQNVYVNSPYGKPSPVYADPFGSILRGSRGY